jgi:abequosyltransferase
VMHDYANYFSPYIKDQLSLNRSGFFHLYLRFAKMGFYRYPIFHFYCLAAYLLGEKGFDAVTRRVREHLGRSPQFGIKQLGVE